MSWQMFNFGDVQCKPVPDQLLIFSEAYLQSADVLTTAICSDTEVVNYAHGAVVMSLTFHAVELFLKAAILQKVPTELFRGHDLDDLYRRYSNLYPKKEMQFQIPFKREMPDTSALESQMAKELLEYITQHNKLMPEDQLHRYPINLAGEAWKASLGFEPYSFSEMLRNLRSELDAIKLRI